MCWLFGRRLADELRVPIGLVSTNWGGTAVQAWSPAESLAECGGRGGELYNSMVAPFALGPMAISGATWYQGEANVGAAKYYACQFPSMVRGWRAAFREPRLWFGFVQIAGWAYSAPSVPPGGGALGPSVAHSHHAGDLRQAQLAALSLPFVGVATTIDVGDWHNIHPPDKQTPATRLAAQVHPVVA